MYVVVSLLFVIASIVILRAAGDSAPYSKGFALTAGLCVIAAICLAQNYTQSLIPEANDGIGVSNRIASWILGEDNWSKERFLQAFENSIYIALVFIVLYPLVLAAEKKRKQK